MTFIKRLVGLPGETVGDLDGRVFVCDGTERPSSPRRARSTAGCRFLDEPYTHGQPTEMEMVTLGGDEWLMLGDNRTGSYDSRFWGPIRRRQMIGPVVATCWPPERAALSGTEHGSERSPRLRVPDRPSCVCPITPEIRARRGLSRLTRRVQAYRRW